MGATLLLTFSNISVAAAASHVQSQRLSVFPLQRVPDAQAWGREEEGAMGWRG